MHSFSFFFFALYGDIKAALSDDSKTITFTVNLN